MSDDMGSASNDRLAPRTRTICIHGAGPAGAAREPLVAPTVRSTVFRLDDEAYRLRRMGRADLSLVYARETNPTVAGVEVRLAQLEGADRALLFASGMAALHAVLMSTLERGDNVVAVRQVYGGTFTLLLELLPRLGVELRTVDVDSPSDWHTAIDASTRLFLCESISNPLTAVADLPAMARALELHERALLVVDATLATPIAQRPLSIGADLVYHSATKYLGGHSDLIGGVVAGGDECLARVWKWRTSAGGCMDPDAAALLDRGLKTLALRYSAHSESALELARFLAAHERVERVHFCGLPGDRNFERAQRLLALPGGLLSFVLRGDDGEALDVIRKLHLVAEAASLGSVESFATRPLDLSHAAFDEAERSRAGIAPGMIRVAVGLEDPLDLIEDFARALD